MFYLLSNSVALMVICAFWLNYNNFNSPRFDLDTNYLRWTSRLPAISVCQADDFFGSNSKTNNNNMHLNKFIHGLIRPEKNMCKGCYKLKDMSDLKIDFDFNAVTIQSVATCQQLFDQCFWNGKRFDCCQRFKKLRTKQGICYTINSQMTDHGVVLSVSHFAKDAQLTFSVNYPIQLYIHEPKDVLFINNKAPVLRLGSTLNLSISSREVLADQSAWSLTPQQRGCVLQGERSLKGHRSYSQSVCKVECETQNQIKLCHCFHHFLPKIVDQSNQCNLTGLMCIDYNFNNPDSRKRKELSKLHHKCKCLPSCEEVEFKVVRNIIKRTNVTKAEIYIEQTLPPTERLILKARVEFLDVLVGFACITRLITNNSLLGLAKAGACWILSYNFVPNRKDILY